MLKKYVGFLLWVVGLGSGTQVIGIFQETSKPMMLLDLIFVGTSFQDFVEFFPLNWVLYIVVSNTYSRQCLKISSHCGNVCYFSIMYVDKNLIYLLHTAYLSFIKYIYIERIIKHL